MLTVRLSASEEKTLNEYAKMEGLSKSEIVKEAIELYLAQNRKNSNPYEVGKEFFGIEGSGIRNKSTTYKKRIKQLLHEKHSR